MTVLTPLNALEWRRAAMLGSKSLIGGSSAEAGHYGRISGESQAARRWDFQRDRKLDDSVALLYWEFGR